MQANRVGPGRVPALVGMDVLALILFVLVGRWSHHEGLDLDVFARNAIPLVASWLPFAAVIGTYRRPGATTLLLTWMVAVPLALVARSIWVGSPEGERLVIFLGVGMVFTLVFLAIGRLTVSLLASKLAVSSPE